MTAEFEHEQQRESKKGDAPAKEGEGQVPSVQLKGTSYAQGKAALRPGAAIGFEAQQAALKPPPLQMKGGGVQKKDVHEIAAQGTQGSGSALPHGDKIQAAFGRHDVSGVQAHIGGAAAEANKSMGAKAYASGASVAFKESPALHTAAHEAAHIVQQRGGVQLKDGVGAAGDQYEQHADAAADAVVQGKSAEGILDQMSGGATRSGVQQMAVQMEEKTDRDSVEALEGYVWKYLNEGDKFRSKLSWEYLKEAYPEHENAKLEKAYVSLQGPQDELKSGQKARMSGFEREKLGELDASLSGPQPDLKADASLQGPQEDLNSGQKARISGFGQIVLNNLSQNYRRNVNAVENFKEFIKIPNVPATMAKTLWAFILDQGVDAMLGAIPGAGGKIAGIAKKAIKEVEKQKVSVAKYNNATAIADFSAGLTAYFESSITAQENQWDGENSPIVAELIGECALLPTTNRESWLTAVGKSADAFRTADLNPAVQEKAIFDMWIALQARVGKGASDRDPNYNRFNAAGELEVEYECDPDEMSISLVRAKLKMAGSSGTVERMKKLQSGLSNLSELNMRKRIRLKSTAPTKYGPAWGVFDEQNQLLDTSSGNPLTSSLARKLGLTDMRALRLTWSQVTPEG